MVLDGNTASVWYHLAMAPSLYLIKCGHMIGNAVELCPYLVLNNFDPRFKQHMLVTQQNGVLC